MTDNARLIREKLDQAVDILNELDVDAWMTFVRETSLAPDPSLELILGMDMVWQSAFIITQDGQRIAIIGHHDAENVKSIGGYTDIVTYKEGLRTELVRILQGIDPRHLALNYSENDVATDGLGHGLMLLLKRYLSDTDLTERFTSAEKVVGALRGRKSPAEIERIKAAIATTQGIFEAVGKYAAPGMTEQTIADYAHKLAAEKGRVADEFCEKSR